MEPPEKPDESDCCNSGCNPCILDVYEQQLKKFRLSANAKQSPLKNTIDPLRYTTFQLIEARLQTHDTYIYIFEAAAPQEDSDLQYEAGQHFLIKAYSKREQNYFTRAYTPIPHEGLSGNQFAVLIKLYEHGEMCRQLRKLSVESRTEWRGPYGDYSLDFDSRSLVCVAQGTGIAPVYAVIRKILENEECETRVKLLYCCRSHGDILLRKQLADCASYWNFSCEVFLTVGGCGEANYGEIVHVRRLERDVIGDFVRGTSVKVLICGSEDFNDCMRGYVVDCGVDENCIFTF